MTRRWPAALAAAAMIPVLAWGFAGLPDYAAPAGDTARLINALSVPARHAINVVTAVTFDFRAMDTLGEELIFFAAVTGATLILRALREERPPERKDAMLPAKQASATTRRVGWLMVAGGTAFGINIATHGHLGPGGGFQGGAIWASAWLLIYLTRDYRAFERATPRWWVELCEAVAAAGFVVVGIVATFGGAFLANILPLGVPGQFLSAGTILLVSTIAGIEIAAGLVLLFKEMVEELQRPPPPEDA